MLVRHAMLAMMVVAGVLCASTTHAQSKSFGFLLEVSSCFTEKFDSFSGTFTQTLGEISFPKISARLFLPDQQMKQIADALESLEFFDFPENYVGTPPGGGRFRV